MPPPSCAGSCPKLGAVECVAGYGLSEASPNIAQSCWWEAEEVRTAALMRPQPGLEVRVVDPATGEPVGPAQSAGIRVRGWSVMTGYFEMPERTAEGARPRRLAGDRRSRTVLDPDGRLAFAGRLKNIVRVGGENVSPEEVEDILHRHPAIRQAQVVGVPDARLQEVCAAFIVLNEGAPLVSRNSAHWAKDKMAGFKVPRHVWFVEGFDGIGMTASAKVQKSTPSRARACG